MSEDSEDNLDNSSFLRRLSSEDNDEISDDPLEESNVLQNTRQQENEQEKFGKVVAKFPEEFEEFQCIFRLGGEEEEEGIRFFSGKEGCSA